jgi:glucose/arabinose dehydrogenase
VPRRPSSRLLVALAAPITLVAAVLPQVSAAVPAESAARPTGSSAAAAAVAMASVATVAPRATATRLVSGLVRPVLVRSARDGSGRLFVVEQAGRVRVIRGRSIIGTYLDIRRLVSSGGERGMLGLAFAPDFVTSHLLWVTYTRGDGALVLARFRTARASSPTVAASSRRTILVIPHPRFANHNGGDIAFGPDGYLYLGTGDGGGSGDAANNAQNLGSLLGKMLRLDVRCAGHLYCSPASNPLTRSTRYRHEIWMWGLRNPWRWSFDTTGALWIGDVGQDRYEEIDAVARAHQRGANFGWSCREAAHVYKAARCSSGVRYVAPVLELCHPASVGGCPAARGAEAIIGGYVYRGRATPGAVGTYVFGDYVTGRIWTYRGGTVSRPTALAGVAGFGVDAGREMYAVTMTGGLYRIGFTRA